MVDVDRDGLAGIVVTPPPAALSPTARDDRSAARGRAVAGMLADYTRRHDVRVVYVSTAIRDALVTWHRSFLRTDGTLPPVRGVPIVVIGSMGGADVTIVHRDGRMVDVHDAPVH